MNQSYEQITENTRVFGQSFRERHTSFQIIGDFGQYFPKLGVFLFLKQIDDGFFNRQPGGEHSGQLAGEKHDDIKGDMSPDFEEEKSNLIDHRLLRFHNVSTRFFHRKNSIALFLQTIEGGLHI